MRIQATANIYSSFLFFLYNDDNTYMLWGAMLFSFKNTLCKSSYMELRHLLDPLYCYTQQDHV